MMQYVPALREAGFEVEVSPLLSDDYVRDIYSGKVSVLNVARSYLQRLRRIGSIGDFDVVWLEKELWPWLPAWLELRVLEGVQRLVVDYDDAVFHRYESHRSYLVRTILGRKIDTLMERADMVTVGNSYLAQRARDAGGLSVSWLPTVIDLARYPWRATTPKPPNERVVVGWIGSPSTAGYLRHVSAALSPLQASGLIRCVAIGARPEQVQATPFEAREWHEGSEASELLQFDIGIMPLPDEAWERGKCGYKLIQYMATGLPVVASPVGVNSEIVVQGENGFLASNGNEWAAAIRTLAESSELRHRMGQSGREKVERIFSVQAQICRLIEMLLNGNNRAAVRCAD